MDIEDCFREGYLKRVRPDNGEIEKELAESADDPGSQGQAMGRKSISGRRSRHITRCFMRSGPSYYPWA